MLKAPRQVRQEIFKKLKYEPSSEQAEVHYADLEDRELRIKQVVGGEQSGKSTCTAREVLSRHMEGKLYWLGGVDYSIPRKEFEYLVEDALKAELLIPESVVMHSDKHSECLLELRRGERVITKSFKDIIKAMTKESPDGIAICEAAQVDWSDIERCQTRVAASRGWLFLSGTMEGSAGYYANKYKEWQAPNAERAKSFSLPSWSNRAIYPGGREDPEVLYQERNLPEDVFMERFAGKPCPLSNYIIPEFRNEIHTGKYVFDPDLDVEVAIDPGYGGAYAVEVMQWRGDTVFIIDEIYLQGYITQDIIEVVQTKPWFKNLRGGVIDIAAKAHQTSAVEPDVDIWRKATRLNLRMNKVDEEPGITRLRSFLKPHPVTKQPQLYIDHSCKGIISECGGGRSPVDGGGAWLRDKNTGKPLKKNNHACKAIYYLLVDRFGYMTIKRQKVGVVQSLNPFAN